MTRSGTKRTEYLVSSSKAGHIQDTQNTRLEKIPGILQEDSARGRRAPLFLVLAASRPARCSPGRQGHAVPHVAHDHTSSCAGRHRDSTRHLMHVIDHHTPSSSLEWRILFFDILEPLIIMSHFDQALENAIKSCDNRVH